MSASAETDVASRRSSEAGPAPRVSDAQIADIFYRLAELYELQSEEPFRIRAYRRAARQIQGLAAPLAEMVASGEDLRPLPAIGDAIATQIVEICRTGTLEGLEAAERRTPPHLRAISRLPGIGPMRLRRLYEHLGVDTIETLREAVDQGHIRQTPGLGPAIEAKLKEALDDLAGQAAARSQR